MRPNRCQIVKVRDLGAATGRELLCDAVLVRRGAVGGMHGRAALKEAEWSKQILIEEARAKETASLMQANARVTLAEAEGKAQVVRAKAEGLADIERAKAAAEANRIIGESLKGNDEYLRYIWIKGLQDGNGERIYIPTEAGLPILEAGKARK